MAEPVADTTDVAQARAETAEEFNSYSGASAPEIAAAPPTTGYSLSSVFATAMQYQGVPYVFGGADPSGFDCSGFVMYVFAQYGISMPHSAAGQGAMGTPVSLADAQPGDLVIMDGHDASTPATTTSCTRRTRARASASNPCGPPTTGSCASTADRPADDESPPLHRGAGSRHWCT
ncbi:Gamma-DL-glutamyl hydrolase precursor [Rathayibacter tanaceti]|uniref:Gamma-DL-glutamyl hydrolase n=1 Tax=Rathayibacter tanaceti TaxID=1671680 RepID=A0A166IG42_9MICO|nr:Gamma-DL-glutamyl hydrolase precursor [Rathayibacter tanaceti]